MAKTLVACFSASGCTAKVAKGIAEAAQADLFEIVLFATSGGSGMGKTVSVLQPSAPGANFVEGEVLNMVLAGS